MLLLWINCPLASCTAGWAHYCFRHLKITEVLLASGDRQRGAQRSGDPPRPLTLGAAGPRGTGQAPASGRPGRCGGSGAVGAGHRGLPGPAGGCGRGSPEGDLSQKIAKF